jgi:hypothetical protein
VVNRNSTSPNNTFQAMKRSRAMITFVIACAPYHKDVVERAIASVRAQTFRSELVVVFDHERKGAGAARNEGLAQVTTPFVSFLDADDTLAPTFAEACLRAYDGRRYVYTDWVAENIVQAPCTPWDGKGNAHIITTVLPTKWVRHVGGFDEALPGLEDSAFYWALTRAGLCGKRLPLPLFTYGKGGQRSQAFRDRADRDEISRQMLERFKGKPMSCGGGCGGGNADEYVEQPVGEQQQGDVLAKALWAGNRQERGRSTGRLYPRTGNGKQLWMSERDIDAAPHLFSRVLEMPAPVTDDEFAAFAHKVLLPPGTPRPETAPAVYGTRGTVQPDFGKVLGLYKQQ